MLGISAELSYKQLQDFKTANDYINYMYHDIKGIFAQAQIKGGAFIQNMKRENGLMEEEFDGKVNTFVSMNSFFVNKRQVKYLKRLNACYVDIDCYKLNLSKEYVLYELEQEYFGSIIPVPSFVIDSGNGLYLIWKLRNEDKKALPRWHKVQNYLYDALKDFGADSACKDAARVLRVPYSVNGKNNNQVEIIEFNDLTFSLYDIINEFDIDDKYKKTNRKKKVYPYGTATHRMRELSKNIAEGLQLELPDFNSFKKTDSFIRKHKKSYEKKYLANHPTTRTRSRSQMLRGRCKDLEILYTTRRGTECKRELGLFLYRHWLFKCTEDSDYALDKTLELNSKMDMPLDEDYVIKRTLSAEKKIKAGGFYNYSIDRIIEVLEITNEEMRLLSFIVPKNNKETKENRKAINKRSYLNRLLKAGKKTKKTKIEERQEKIEKLLSQGESRESICSVLGISKATYQRDVKAIKDKNMVVTEEKREEQTDFVSKDKKLDSKLHEYLENLKNFKNLKNCGVSFFNTLYYNCSVATARLRVGCPFHHYLQPYLLKVFLLAFLIFDNLDTS